MKSPFECLRYAQQCRALANGNSEDRRREVLRMADIWEGPARDSVHRRPEQIFPADSRDRDRRNGFGLDPKVVWAAGIRARFDEVGKEPLPNRFRDLLKQFEVVDRRR